MTRERAREEQRGEPERAAGSRAPCASVPRNSSEHATAIVKEYSPASVLVSVPPMMWWSNRMVASPPSLKNRKAVAPTANSARRRPRHADARGRTRTPPIGQQHRPERGDELERDVVRQHDVEQDDEQRGEREVELPGREPRVGVVATSPRPATAAGGRGGTRGTTRARRCRRRSAVVLRNSSRGCSSMKM